MSKKPSHQLFLLRHAKSSWNDLSLADHDRPLALRGLKATALLRAYFRKSGVAPALVLCSSAVRAVQTLEGVRPALPAHTLVEVDPLLYGASGDALLLRLRALPDRVASVMLVNHSPAIEQLAVGLAQQSEDAALLRMKSKYPTGGFASLRIQCHWSDLSWRSAILEEFVVPRDLA